LLRLCFGAAYLPALTAARILIVAAIPLSFNVLAASGCRAMNRPMLVSTAEMVSLAVTGLGLWTLLPAYGFVGAAIASGLAYGAMAIFLLIALWLKLDVGPLELLFPTPGDLARVAGAIHLRRNRGICAPEAVD